MPIDPAHLRWGEGKVMSSCGGGWTCNIVFNHLDALLSKRYVNCCDDKAVTLHSMILTPTGCKLLRKIYPKDMS